VVTQEFVFVRNDAEGEDLSHNEDKDAPVHRVQSG